MTRWSVLSLLVLAACPKQAAPPAAPVAQQPGVGCPSASGVYVASYVGPLAEGQPALGWVLALHGTASDAPLAPGDAFLDAEAARAAGVPAAPASVWVLPPGAPMCKATLGRYVASTLTANDRGYTLYSVELKGCPPPKPDAPYDAIALDSDAPPSACSVSSPRPVATRLGDFDDKGAWTPPVKETPLPPALAALVPANDCAAPACDRLWAAGAVEQGGKPVAYGAAVNWLTRTTAACPWQTEAWSGFFTVGADGALAKVTDGQNHPLALTTALTDASGKLVLLAQGPGEYTAYDVAAGAATVGHHVVWSAQEPGPEDAVDHLGPDCSAPSPPTNP
jgi:hypothetical protein